jgi:hypothetical protein
MLFILQDNRESDALSLEIEELRCELDSNANHSYIIANSKFFQKRHDDEWLKNAIPVGTIEFVKAYLKHIHKIEKMNPIEVPIELRMPKFLLRNYELMKYADIPKGEYKFIKNASTLKQPTYIGDTSNVFKEGWLVNLNDLYQVSDVLDILSEYRVIVLRDRIIGIQFYDGSPIIMPNEREVKKIQEMVIRYSQNKERPLAYTMDIAITRVPDKDLNNRDLALLEVQSFASCGTYGCRGYFLPELYALGLKWYLGNNHQIEV